VTDLVVGADGIARCGWVGTDTPYEQYHDREWGVPLHTDRALFEKLCLEAFQAGLSWRTVLHKRPAFRRAFDGFAIEIVAHYGPTDVERLVADAGIIRNRGKIEAIVQNAVIALELTRENPGALERLMWSYRPDSARPRPRTTFDLATTTAESTALSQALRTLGFRFVGPTTMHALMQSTGMIDDHLVGCWRAGGAPRP